MHCVAEGLKVKRIMGLAVMCFLGVPALGAQIVRWTESTVSVQTSSPRSDLALRTAVSFVASHALLHQDIWGVWQRELEKCLLGDPHRYEVNVAYRPQGSIVTLDSRQLTRDVVGVLFGQITPRIAVCATETLLRRPPVPDPAVETAANKHLLDCGFQVVDLEAVDAALARENMLQAINGDAASREWIETELHADCLIYAQGVAVEVRQGSVEVRSEIKGVEVPTGRLLAVASDKTISHGQTTEIAAKQGLERATSQAMPKLVAAMLNAFGKPIHRIRLWHVRSLSEIARVKKGLLSALPGAQVRISSMDLRAGGVAVVEVTTKASSDEVGLALESMEPLKVHVTDLGCRHIVGQLQ